MDQVAIRPEDIDELAADLNDALIFGGMLVDLDHHSDALVVEVPGFDVDSRKYHQITDFHESTSRLELAKRSTSPFPYITMGSLVQSANPIRIPDKPLYQTAASQLQMTRSPTFTDHLEVVGDVSVDKVTIRPENINKESIGPAGAWGSIYLDNHAEFAVVMDNTKPRKSHQITDFH